MNCLDLAKPVKQNKPSSIPSNLSHLKFVKSHLANIALWYYFSMERCCHSQLMADASGETTKIPHDTAIKTREFIANDLAAWASFQPLLDMITKKEPDLLD
jgi:hypothetical protein